VEETEHGISACFRFAQDAQILRSEYLAISFQLGAAAVFLDVSSRLLYQLNLERARNVTIVKHVKRRSRERKVIVTLR
jgi:hypothetical protein